MQRRIVVGESGEGIVLGIVFDGSWRETMGERRVKVESGFGF